MEARRNVRSYRVFSFFCLSIATISAVGAADTPSKGLHVENGILLRDGSRTPESGRTTTRSSVDCSRIRTIFLLSRTLRVWQKAGFPLSASVRAAFGRVMPNSILTTSRSISDGWIRS